MKIKNKLLIIFVALFLISFIFASGIGNMDEEELGEVTNKDLINQIQSSEYKLLKNENILHELSLRAEEDISILNENPLVKTEWLRKFAIKERASGEGIEFEEVIVSEDKTTVKTKGTDSCVFNLEDVFGSTLTEEGGVILGSGAEIKSATITEDEEGILNFEGGIIDLDNCSNQEFNFKNTIIKLNGKKFYSDNDESNYFGLRNGEINLEGIGIYERDLETGEKVSDLSGSMKINGDGDKLLGDETAYATYVDGERSKLFFVKEPITYLQDKDCIGIIECISEKQGSIEINTKDNDVDFYSLDYSLEDVKINKIEGYGKVSFHGKESQDPSQGGESVNVLFLKDGIDISGNPCALNSNIKGEFERKGQEWELNYLKDGKLTFINGEMVGGLYSLKPKGDNLLFSEHIMQEGVGKGSILDEEVIINELDIEKGGNIYIRGAVLYETISRGISKGSSIEDYFETSTEIYQLDDSLIIPSGKKFSSMVGSFGMSYKEALANALNEAAQYKRQLVQSETLNIRESSGKTNKDFFRTSIERSSNVCIENYEVVKTDRYKSGGKWQYRVWIDAEFGELKRD